VCWRYQNCFILWERNGHQEDEVGSRWVGRRGRSSSRRKVYSKQEEEEDPERRKRKVYSGANTVNEEEEGEVGSVHGALQTCLSDP
jgi:hypothetical protein